MKYHTKREIDEMAAAVPGQRTNNDNDNSTTRVLNMKIKFNDKDLFEF